MITPDDRGQYQGIGGFAMLYYRAWMNEMSHCVAFLSARPSQVYSHRSRKYDKFVLRAVRV
jgi:hypothetical protein